MATGVQMLELARSRIDQRYVNVCVPKNNPNWQGPWDCAEFMSWLVYQLTRRLYGCVDDDGDPATVEAYTGAWERDAKRLGRLVPWELAAGIAGAVLLRYPPVPGSMGHIVVSDGVGGTVEAMGKRWGVTTGKSSGRDWDTGILLPGFEYDAPSRLVLSPPGIIYAIGRPRLDPEVTKRIQTALLGFGVDPGPVDGVFGANTTAAVAAFQSMKGLVADGKVGRQTARALKISLV
uniref:peptidoglycan-binding domain-containing protein n=1 Tax=Altererythrobacter segetis TaxID=1104773 RepID=UPI0014087BC7|nr:peptidoglycan-binding domain-containing protein [Altererythrobacter segetis]